MLKKALRHPLCFRWGMLHFLCGGAGAQEEDTQGRKALRKLAKESEQSVGREELCTRESRAGSGDAQGVRMGLQDFLVRMTEGTVYL